MKKVIILIILIILLVSLLMIKKNDNYDLEIYFFNAGKADAILISKNDKYIMIDTGEEDLTDDILTYFRNHSIERLEYLIITHFDKDHVGSASSIIENIEVGSVLQSNVEKESDSYNNYLKALEDKNINPITVTDNYEIELEGMNIVVNGPNKIYDNNESNNSSLIVSIDYNDTSFLFMGDSQNARIKDFLELNDKTYDFIKMPYHGNYLKRLDELLNEIDVKYAVITNEEYDNQTVDLLNKYNIDYYLTKRGVRLLSDGNSIKIE